MEAAKSLLHHLRAAQKAQRESHSFLWYERTARKAHDMTEFTDEVLKIYCQRCTGSKVNTPFILHSP